MMAYNNKMKRTNLYLTQRQYKTVKKIAQEREVTFSEVFRGIIDQYIESKSKWLNTINGQLKKKKP
jgi:hypothetical protein|tara:strand:+ start:88 stop:285 length:198 start_codon:yes stop_codon:yes gene_type:complete